MQCNQKRLSIFKILICAANQWTGFYMTWTSVMKVLNTLLHILQRGKIFKTYLKTSVFTTFRADGHKVTKFDFFHLFHQKLQRIFLTTTLSSEPRIKIVSSLKINIISKKSWINSSYCNS